MKVMYLPLDSADTGSTKRDRQSWQQTHPLEPSSIPHYLEMTGQASEDARCKYPLPTDVVLKTRDVQSPSRALSRAGQRAPVEALSRAKQSALAECLANNGLHKQKGHWQGAAHSKPTAGNTIADLSRDGLLKLSKHRGLGSAHLTERGIWFAQTLIWIASERDY